MLAKKLNLNIMKYEVYFQNIVEEIENLAFQRRICWCDIGKFIIIRNAKIGQFSEFWIFPVIERKCQLPREVPGF